MKLKFTLVRPGGQTVDLVATVDATVSVGDLASAVERCDPVRQAQGARAPRLSVSAIRSGEASARGTAGDGPVLTLRVHAGGPQGPTSVLAAGIPLATSGLRSGSFVSLAAVTEQWHAPGANGGPSAATLTVLTGPEAGRTIPLREGTCFLGRAPACDIRLTDPLVSKRHARITIGDTAEIIDLGSANGLVIGGVAVPRAVLRPQDRVIVGDTAIGITLHRTSASSPTATADVDFNRSPRLDPTYAGLRFEAPEAPERPPRARLPILAMLAPLIMGAALFAFTRSALSVLFVALSPILVIGSYLDERLQSRRNLREATAVFEEALRALRIDLRQALALEQVGRLAEAPSTTDSVDAIHRQTALLWTRRGEHDRFLTARLGTGTLPSRHTVVLPSRARAKAEHWHMLTELQSEVALVHGVPVVVELPACGGLGIAGPRSAAVGVARGVLLQFAALHSPADLTVAAVTSSDSGRDWDALKWLPHNGSAYSPLSIGHLADETGAGTRLIAEIEQLIVDRSSVKRDPRKRMMPALLVLVEDDAPVERHRLVGIAENGPEQGIHVLWVAASQERLPAACRTYVTVDPGTGEVTAGFVTTAFGVAPVVCETVDQQAAMLAARALAPVADAGAGIADESDLPRSISFLTLIGTDLAQDPASVLERWHESESVIDRAAAAPVPRKTTSLRAVVGQAAGEPLALDLRTQGPHALVGGTTGAGKSEFLQSWVLGMAAGYSPDTLTFLFVDYKGGAAFADCVHLPHTVGLVTDLSPHLVRRALASLNAELRHREHILNAKKAKDLLELQRRGDPEAPPSLVIVVDEFAALVQEVPEFVDGVVNIAQRGRSLGLHLILATQRPAGVIKDNLRANTNLRIALRMADENDSTDVLGVPLAAGFSPDIPGRGAAKTGPGRIAGFQTGYVGGWSQRDAPAAQVSVGELAFGPGRPWDEPQVEDRGADVDLGPTDIVRLVATISQAAGRAEIPAPRKPWLPDMAPTYDLQFLGQRRDRELALGVIDDPNAQQQRTAYFYPDLDGNMAVYGTGGSGKSTLLRTVALAAGITPRSGPCQVYGLDFGSSGLRMLETLPHVGSIISGDDDERINRLMRWLKTVLDERAGRYAAVRAGSITEYRDISGHHDEPRILLLVDGIANFRQQYESHAVASIFAMFTQIAADGRPVGVHVVVTADRAASIPSSLRAAIQRTAVLRLADDSDYNFLGVPADAMDGNSPPGRGVLDGLDLQVAVLGGSPNLAVQSKAVDDLARTLRARGVVDAPAIGRLPNRVLLAELPPGTSGVPIGIAGNTLAPIEFEPEGYWVLAGPPGSGTPDVLVGLAAAIARDRPGIQRLLVSGRKSAVEPSLPWTAILRTDDDLERWTAAVAAAAATTVLFVEDVAGLVGTAMEQAVFNLAQALGRAGGGVIAESETGTWSQYSDLLKLLRGQRKGFLVQPDQADGDNLLRTDLPRGQRKDFAVCGGAFVLNGSVTKVQFVEAS
ncbi:DNA segregation ATPase FtsK/SpoIIIE, S-DNA-T family [Nakamurella panacisegetis]|uniref:DNA segregation ATPase FtsK/SpoIIIE, S-DNA-T family n=1 Tax=Nakamurella panacisegetis TaxID=1090615 RepID=A0A1H0PBC1_9ACTN|nr:FtsK/SpoIIIE domain-containing protein [Nakamurella panacisegetis]SDP02060.1 DNA segregation ATPase FtsK/SpoIIIE, S-DNA-T family [Nakamurella panacisegetis]